MRLYAWSGVATGAYHADGVAVVLANSEEEARALLAAEDQPDADGWPPTYTYAGGLDQKDWDTELRIVELTEPTVVLTYAGCDC